MTSPEAKQPARDDAPSQPVAVIGLGTMGHAMALNARLAGLSTIVWNREPERTRDLADVGAVVAATAADAARGAAVVVTMVTDLDAVLDIANEQGMLDAIAPGAVWVQMSTIGLGVDRVAALVAARRPDVTFVDAPVSGSKQPAESGSLTIFASGPDEVRTRVTPFFDAIGHRTTWVGAAGAGSRVKLVNNTMLALTAEGLATSVVLSRRLGLGRDTLLDALDGSPIVSQWTAAKLRRAAIDDYSPEFSLANALKDVRLALDAVDADDFAVLKALAGEWQRVEDRGLGNEDVTVVTRALDDGHAHSGA